ncbi:MAG: glycosyltransferase family 9 protein [Candidatus Tantalella remota]|nr:glycosyltransferase family 9 protein [Candidatus Tantalella remota]
MKKILIANIFGIGDVLFTTPLIANIKRAIEGVSIDYVCNARCRDLVSMMPEVEKTYIYEKDFYTDLWKRSKPDFFKALGGFFSDIRKNKYDAYFDFTLSRESGLFYALAGIPRRIGLDYKKRGLFLTEKISLEGFEERHVIEYYLDLLALIGVPVSEREMQIVPEEPSLEWARSYLEGKVDSPERIVVMIPGGGASWGQQASRKRWHSEGFVRAADMLTAEGMQIAVFGDSSERELCLEIAGKMKTAPVIVENDLGIKEYAALLSLMDLAVCNDGGPLHMAVALGVSTVSIFGPVDDRVYGPYPLSSKHRVVSSTEAVCRPCYNRFKLPDCEYDIKCLTDIKPETVAGACMEVLAKSV